MAATVRQQILTDVKTQLQTVTIIKDIEIWPSRLPQEQLRKPYVAIFDLIESSKRMNRIKKAEFTLHIETYIHSSKSEDMSEDMEDVYAAIQSILMSEENPVSTYIDLIEEISFEKFVYSDVECGFVNLYRILYAHERGKPFTI